MAEESLLTLNNDIWLSLTEDGYMDRFLNALLNDLPGQSVKSIENIQVSEIASSLVADKTIKKGEFKNITGFCIKAVLDGKVTEIILLDEEIPYLQWWHDKSFFTLNYFNEHTRAVSDGYDDVQVRMVVSFILDKDVNLDKFHTCKHFNKINPDGTASNQPDQSFYIHDLNFLCIPTIQSEETQLSLWAALLIATDINEIQRIAQKQL
ncbi:MAG: hypothetical protein K5752_05740 [Succinivibrionaceae bacterium]|nr:hypothetical protein [Succinivibrionaceae bacterium]